MTVGELLVAGIVFFVVVGAVLVVRAWWEEKS
jgi:hypothetical protein